MILDPIDFTDDMLEGEKDPCSLLQLQCDVPTKKASATKVR